MIKNLFKIIIIMMILMTTFIPISNASGLDDIFEQGDNFVELGKNEGGDTLLDQNKLKITVKQVYNIVFGIGVALSVLIGAILGIKFMIGSVEEQAKVKETLIPYILGCIVVFGAFGIWKIILTLGGDIF